MAENINNTSLNDENSVSSFDYKAFLLMMLLRWPIILGCVLVALIGSFFYIKTLTPQYTVSSTILIKDESKSKSGKSGIDLQELGLITSSAQNFDNELGILQTHTLVKKVVCNLNLYIHYSSPGTFRSEELYKDNAVNVWVTPEDAEKIKHADVRMKLTDKKVLDVEIKTKEKTFTNHFDRLPAVLPTEIGVFSFSLPDTTVIAKQNVAEDEEGKKDENAPIVVEASINAPSIATKSYLTRLTVAATSKTTTIANLTLTDSHIERAKDFLTSLVNLYNQEANNDKNEVAARLQNSSTNVSLSSTKSWVLLKTAWRHLSKVPDWWISLTMRLWLYKNVLPLKKHTLTMRLRFVCCSSSKNISITTRTVTM